MEGPFKQAEGFLLHISPRNIIPSDTVFKYHQYNANVTGHLRFILSVGTILWVLYRDNRILLFVGTMHKVPILVLCGTMQRHYA